MSRVPDICFVGVVTAGHQTLGCGAAIVVVVVMMLVGGCGNGGCVVVVVVAVGGVGGDCDCGGVVC